MSYDFDHPPEGMSSGAKTAIGCGLAAFLCMALICGGIGFVTYLAFDKAEGVVKQVIAEMEKQVEAFAAPFEAQGFERVTGQVVEVTSDIQKPTVYTVQVFKLEANSEADLAVMAQVAEINGTINGDLHFFGQTLKIHPDAVITGDLHVQVAQVVDNRGTVQGNIIEDDRPDLNIPFPETKMTPTEGERPSPGDVIDKPGSETSGDSATDPSEPAKPDSTPTETEPDESVESSERQPGDPVGSSSTGDN